MKTFVLERTLVTELGVLELMAWESVLLSHQPRLRGSETLRVNSVEEKGAAGGVGSRSSAVAG